VVKLPAFLTECLPGVTPPQSRPIQVNEDLDMKNSMNDLIGEMTLTNRENKILHETKKALFHHSD